MSPIIYSANYDTFLHLSAIKNERHKEKDLCSKTFRTEQKKNCVPCVRVGDFIGSFSDFCVFSLFANLLLLSSIYFSPHVIQSLLIFFSQKDERI